MTVIFQFDIKGWLPITVGHPDWMSTILLHGTEEGHDQLEAKDFSLEEHMQRATGLAETVRKIHAHFLDQRGPQSLD